MSFQPVIGLEVHAELDTETKMYCTCRNEFGGEPNSRCCPVCTGMPGALPSLNKKAVEFAMLAGAAMNAKIASKTVQSRKNYFYPDLPKGYQISQFALPLCTDGEFEYFFEGEVKRAAIRQIHIEEDAGKLIHLPSGETLIDYNRCGVPLIEIVTQPIFHSPEQARAFLDALKTMLMYLGISDCRMQEGSLRCDVNVSLREDGCNELMPRVEMKNVNTFSGAERAIRYEIKRQTEILKAGGKVEQQTRRWDDEKRESFLLRSKENSADYRYFPEPDIPVIEISNEEKKQIKALLPEFEIAKRMRYINEMNVPEATAAQISANPKTARFFDKCIEFGASEETTANLIISQVQSCVNESKIEIAESGLTVESFAEVVKAIETSEISVSAGKRAVVYLFENGGSAGEAIEKLGLCQLSDRAQIDKLVAQVIEENPQAVSDYMAGKKNAFGFLTGQCMRKSGGRANPHMLCESIKENLERRVN